MILSDIAVKRPVFATVISLLLVAFGLLAFDRLPLREYPDINPPIVSVETNYGGASAEIVETRVTQIIEERISGVEGIRSISSVSQDGQSEITIEFTVDRDIDAAANDVRERVARVLDNLPEEADPPEIFKVDANASVIMWLNLASETMSGLELTDFAERFLVDRLSVVEGVARVRVGGGLRYAMRVWLDRQALAARNLTVADVEAALRAENVELPAGTVNSLQRDFTVRIERGYRTPDDFARLVIARGDDGYLVRLGEVARVELGPEEYRNELRGNREEMVGLGIIRQSTANTLAVARGVKAEAERIRPTLPPGVELLQSYDTSVFIEGAINEVYKTLFIAMVMVVLVILLFLGNVRATLVPAVTVPVSLIASSMILLALGFSLNLLTLLALVLAIGLVVDDAIVVLENISRRIEEGEPPLLAAYRGARQVGFAVIATTLVLISVFVPLAFLQGNVGRLFSEFALAMAAAVAFSSLVALTLSPVMCSKLLKRPEHSKRGARRMGPAAAAAGLFKRLERGYRRLLSGVVDHPGAMALVIVAVLGGIVYLFANTPREFAPREDRGAFFVFVSAPEGASFEYTQRYMRELEERMMPLVESGEATRVLTRIPRFGAGESYDGGIGIVVLEHWNERERSTDEIMAELRQSFAEVPGVRAFPVMRQSLSGSNVGKPVQFVIGGPSYEVLARWRDVIVERARENPGLAGVDSDFKETTPQLQVAVDRDRAADLGVSVENVGRTLETMMGSRQVTTFLERGEEYDVILEAERSDKRSAQDMTNIYVRSERSGELIPLSNLLTFSEEATSAELNRYNRVRAITIEANLTPGYTLGEALTFLEDVVRSELPPGATVDYKGESLEFKRSGGSVLFIFALAVVVVFLVLAAQFESFIHPLTIMLTVPLAVFGALVGLNIMGQTINIYSQIGIIMLVGLAAKNGILIVEFANQLRDAGYAVREALLTAAQQRLRPILMTGITTAAGAVPLILAFGPGAESRTVLGVVVFSGVAFATVFTLFVVPSAYLFAARLTRSPRAVADEVERLDQSTPAPEGPWNEDSGQRPAPSH